MVDWSAPVNRGMPPGAVNPMPKRPEKSFLDSWTDRSAVWAARQGIGESLDRYFGLDKVGTNYILDKQLQELFGLEAPISLEHDSLGYKDILKLRDNHLKWKDVTWKNYKNKVMTNTEEFRAHVKYEPLKNFFQDISVKDYAKQTLWKGNIKPIKTLLSGSSDNLFKNLGYSAGVGFMGFNVLKTGHQHYQYWKKKENGSLASQWRTAYETIKASGEKAIQSLSAWEAAGIGVTIGQALLPLGSIPIAGIIIGGLFATTAYKAVGKLFPALAKPELSSPNHSER